MPDLFIYLVEDGKKKKSFIRKSAKSIFTELQNGPVLYYFKPDKSVCPKLRDDESGIVKMRLGIGQKDAFNRNLSGWDDPIKKPLFRQGYLFANIYHV